MAGENDKGKAIVIEDSPPQPIFPSYSTNYGTHVTAQPFDLGAGPSRLARPVSVRDFFPGAEPVDHITHGLLIMIASKINQEWPLVLAAQHNYWLNICMRIK